MCGAIWAEKATSGALCFCLGGAWHNFPMMPPGGWRCKPALCTCRTELHFVRCIKPNNEQAQEDYDAALVLHQLRCCGITEVARIARAGYPTRYAHQQFAQRYSSLLGNKVPRKLAAPEACSISIYQAGVGSCLAPGWQ